MGITTTDPAVRVNAAEVFKALGNATRITVLELFQPGSDTPAEWSAKELAAHLEMPLSNVSFYVKGLREAGLIEMVRTEPRRGALEKWHRITDAGERALELVEHAESL